MLSKLDVKCGFLAYQINTGSPHLMYNYVSVYADIN